MKTVQINGKLVGDGHPYYFVAEIGINHNGSVETTKQLINVAATAGCDAVKFQKRTVDIVYSPEELAKARENPFGLTNGDLKRGLEFGQTEYAVIDEYCRTIGISWFASCWDELSVDFIAQFNVPCYKIASASLTDDALLMHTRSTGKPIILSTGMSSLEEVDHAVEILGTEDLVLMHTVSTYPAKYLDLNLRVIESLKKRYGVPVGYSGHETGIASSVVAAAMGACILERHITLDRSMWGSDQAASLEPNGINKLVRDVRLVEQALGSPDKHCLVAEEPVKAKLRRK